MALCPICGCKTDELDFVTDKISDSEVKMCSFCQRQIHAFDEGKEPGDGHIRWLSSVTDKVVSERSDEVNEYLGTLKEKYVTEANTESVVISGNTPPVSADTKRSFSRELKLSRMSLRISRERFV